MAKDVPVLPHIDAEALESVQVPAWLVDIDRARIVHANAAAAAIRAHDTAPQPVHGSPGQDENALASMAERLAPLGAHATELQELRFATDRGARVLDCRCQLITLDHGCHGLLIQALANGLDLVEDGAGGPEKHNGEMSTSADHILGLGSERSDGDTTVEGHDPSGADGPSTSPSDDVRTLQEIARQIDAIGTGPVGGDAAHGGGEMVASQDRAMSVSATEDGLSSGLRNILQALPLALGVVDDGKLLFANRQFAYALGFADGETAIAAGGLTHLFPELDDGRLAVPADGNGSSEPVQTDARTQSRRIIPVSLQLQPVDWGNRRIGLLFLKLGTAVPVAAQSGPTGGLEGFIDRAADVLAIADHDGRLEWLNASGRQLTGRDPDQRGQAPAPDLMLSDLFTEDSWPAMAAAIGTIETTPSDQSSPLSEVVRVGAVLAPPEGEGIAVQVALARAVEGDRTRLYCLMTDIRAANAEAEALAAAKTAAEYANAVKSDFLAKVSHEVRTPLNSIIGFAELIKDERFGPLANDRYKGYLHDIHESGLYALSLINDLLDLSKIEAGKLELELKPVSVDQVISQCISTLQPLAKREQIVLRVALEDGLPQVLADARSLRQVMLNLLSNAIKFTEPGGQVIASAAPDQDGGLCIRVRDTGVGMSESEIAQAMEPFRQLDTAPRKQIGTGLGLPLTKALVEANRAQFHIDSRSGAGTRIEIVFPHDRLSPPGSDQTDPA